MGRKSAGEIRAGLSKSFHYLRLHSKNRIFTSDPLLTNFFHLSKNSHLRCLLWSLRFPSLPLFLPLILLRTTPWPCLPNAFLRARLADHQPRPPGRPSLHHWASLQLCRACQRQLHRVPLCLSHGGTLWAISKYLTYQSSASQLEARFGVSQGLAASVQREFLHTRLSE